MQRSVTVKLDERLVEQIDQLARQKAVDENRNVTRTEMFSQALIDYLKKAGKEKDHAE